MATIRDVARRAGVAPSTVSYVFTGARSISEETRERVREAVDALGYQPRDGTRIPRVSRTRALALALPGAGEPRHSVDGRFAIGVSDSAGGLGYGLLLTPAEDRAGGLRRVVLDGLADAAVLMAVESDDARIDVVRELAFPAALIGRPPDEGALPWADLDWEEAAALAVRELSAAGHTDIVYLAPGEAEVRARRGYALRGIAGARGGALGTGAAVKVAHAVDDPAKLGSRLRTLLSDPTGGGRRRTPTALIVQHPSAHHHILASVTAAGLRVPADLTVMVIGALPGDPAGRGLPRIELPVQALADGVTRLAVSAAAALREAAAPGTEPGARLLAASLGHLLLAPELLSGALPLSAPAR
jgi:DNA-binding LacI/PurR family transcriptional regulator